MKKTIKILSYLLILIFFITFSAFAIGLAVTQSVKLDLSKLKKNQSTVILCYANGDEIKRRSSNLYVEFNDIPSHVINSLIAIEDKRFYSHSGVDAKGIFRALKNNFFSKNTKQGGSTITQQLVKNAYLSGEKTISRKLKEMRLAVELERKLSKEQILEAYLNTVYFGEGAYGIASASNRFFNKSVGDLTLDEGAVLVACLKAPSIYSPYKNLQKSKQRRDLILSEMLNQGYINQNDYNIAKNKEIIINYETNYEIENVLYDEVLQEALSVLNLNNMGELNGYKIYTSIDKSLYSIMSSPLDFNLDCDYSIMIAENSTGKILCYNSNVGNLKRCPASAAKPWLIYAPAIEENLICPATKILDEKTNFDGYYPSNYNDKYYGYVNVKDCLAMSLNVPSIKICNALGSEKVKEYAKKLGITYTNDDLSIALGNLSGGITLKELSDAYSVFVNDGVFRKSSLISKIMNSKGKTVYQSKPTLKRVFSNSTAFLINDMLKTCAKEGTASKLKDLPFEVCAKTGTNGNDKGNLDAYCIAYTTKHTVAVWLGNADGKLMSNNITGGNYPTKIAKEILLKLYADYTPDNFTTPNSVKEISIDKDFYNEDCKIYNNVGDEKDGLKFWFKNDYRIENPPNQNQPPNIISYKITCKYCDIVINCETDKDVYYKILDQHGNELFNSYFGKEFLYKAPKKGQYTFTLLPYKIQNGKEVYGEKIKLPSVLVEGKSDILDTDWWED